VTAEDYHCECPSQLFIELAIVTKDDRVPILLKNATQSVMAKRAGKQQIFTCGPEHGFVWSKHVDETSEKKELKIETALQDAIKGELGVMNNEILSWEIFSLVTQHLHLNTALLGVVKINLSSIELEQRLKTTAKYHDGVERFLTRDQLWDQIHSDFGREMWHGTGLMRLSLAAQFLGAVPP
jgi:hypothetical protein